MFPQIMRCAVVLILLVAGGVAPTRAEWDEDRRPTPSALLAIAEWVSANTDLPMTRNLPAVDLVPLGELKRLRDAGSAAFYFGGGPTAVYDDAAKIIYLPEDWTGRSPTEQSMLVHEMVNHMQNQAGMKYACDDARAEPAYLAQDKWLQQHGLTLKQAFQVDRFMVEVMATCM
jgi:hypothetical protein